MHNNNTALPLPPTLTSSPSPPPPSLPPFAENKYSFYRRGLHSFFIRVRHRANSSLKTGPPDSTRDAPPPSAPSPQNQQ